MTLKTIAAVQGTYPVPYGLLRSLILEAVQNSPAPIRACEVQKVLLSQGWKTNQATIHRKLAQLVEERLLEKKGIFYQIPISQEKKEEREAEVAIKEAVEWAFRFAPALVPELFPKAICLSAWHKLTPKEKHLAQVDNVFESWEEVEAEILANFAWFAKVEVIRVTGLTGAEITIYQKA
jgi:hypothetical protein